MNGLTIVNGRVLSNWYFQIIFNGIAIKYKEDFIILYSIAFFNCCACVWAQFKCGNQRTALWSCFSLCTFLCVLGIEPCSLCLCI